MGGKPRHKHRLKPITLNVPNLPSWTIYYCSTCDEAWTSRLVAIRSAQCPSTYSPVNF